MTTTDTYFNLSGLGISSVGTLGTHYYESSARAYDNEDRVLRSADSMSNITASVYDAAGRVIQQWRGLSDSGATRTDPSNSGANDIKKVQIAFYDTNGDGTGTPRTFVTRSQSIGPIATLAGTSADYSTVNFEYDSAGRQTWIEPDTGPWTSSQYDADSRVVETDSATNGSKTTLLAKSTTAYDNAGRVSAQNTFEVTGGSSTGDYLQSLTTYDSAGRTFKVTRATGGFTKTLYDAAGHALQSFFSSDEGASSALTDDIVVTEADYSYDPAGNVIQVTRLDRDHDATATGALSATPSAARVTYEAMWYDDSYHLTFDVNYGTNAGGAFTRPEPRRPPIPPTATSLPNMFMILPPANISRSTTRGSSCKRASTTSIASPSKSKITPPARPPIRAIARPRTPITPAAKSSRKPRSCPPARPTRSRPTSIPLP